MPPRRTFAYGEDPELQSLDVFRVDDPTPPRGRPIVAYVYGGAWTEPDPGHHESKAAFFSREGFLFAAIRYRLSPAVRHPAHVDDVARAVAWLHANAGRLGADGERIFLVGHSSGAQLAALVAAAPEHLERHGARREWIRAVALLDGSAYDVPSRMAGARDDGWYKKTLLAAFGDDPAIWRDASPAVRSSPGTPPFLIFHLRERDAAAEQSRVLAQAVLRAGSTAAVIPVDDRTHATIHLQLGADGDAIAPRIADFFRAAGG